jgi:uncharacterized membrane protein YgdD (TMEM256/DUF423 family)
MSWALLFAALFGSTGVMLGALSAHGLDQLTPSQLASWHTAVNYQLLHAIALLAIGLFESAARRRLPVPTGLFALGIVAFSGSIYLLVLGGPSALGPVTPVGGVAFLLGWLSLLVVVRRPDGSDR